MALSLESIQGTLTTLNDQIREGSRKLKEAQEEVSKLREDKRLLIERLKRRDQRIDKLEKDREELRDRLERKRREDGQEIQAQPSTDGEQHKSLSRVDKDLPRFTTLPRDHPERVDIFDSACGKDEGGELRLLSKSWEPSRISAEILREHKWTLTAVDFNEHLDSTGGQGEPNHGGRQCDTPTSPQDPPQHRTLSTLRKRYHDEVGKDDESSDCSPRKRTNAFSPARRQYFHPSDPGRDSLEHTIFGRYARDARPLPTPLRQPRRKSICVHCWLTSGFCDFYGQCGTCRVSKVKCVRKLCQAGEHCGNVRCPCLHPGEWDERDPDWIVEEGAMPRKFGLVESGLADRYRPGEVKTNERDR